MLATLFSAAFNLLMRVGQDRRCDTTALGAISYITSASYNIAVLAATGMRGAAVRSGSAPHAASLLVGAAGGCAFVAAYFLTFQHLRRRGVTITMAVTRLAALVPVAVSMVVWRDRTTPLQLLGGAFAVISLPFLCARPSQRGEKRGVGAILLAPVLFMVQGLCLLAPRVFNQTGIRGENGYYLTALFGAAAIASSGVWVAKSVHARRVRMCTPNRPVLATVILGVGLGLLNTFASQFLVSSLLELPSILVFPFYSTVGLLIIIIFSQFVWRETVNHLETAGIVMTCAAIVLMNIA
jgi:drug/metabolite transporter (DMT)-like permease